MSLRVETSGAGPDLVLLHGWGLGAGAWDCVLPALAERFRVHRVSLPGYDGTPDDGGDFRQIATAIAATIPAGAMLCGWSLGGMLGIAAAATNRNAGPARLVLVGTTMRFVQDGEWTAAQTPASHDAFSAAVAADPATALRRFVMLFNQGDQRVRDVVRTLTRSLPGVPASTPVLLRGLDWLRDADLRSLLPKLTLPTLVLHGECDPLMPLAAGECLATTLPNARLEVYAGCAHAPFVSDPARFVARLAEFCETSSNVPA